MEKALARVRNRIRNVLTKFRKNTCAAVFCDFDFSSLSKVLNSLIGGTACRVMSSHFINYHVN